MNEFDEIIKMAQDGMNGLYCQGIEYYFLYNVNLYGYGLISSGEMCSSDKDIYYY